MKHLKKFNEDFNTNDSKIESDTNILDPKFSDKNAEEFMERLGVNVTKSENGENVFIRKAKGTILYSFVNKEDCEAFKDYVIKNNIEIYKELTAEGARYPYQILFHRG